MRQNRFSSLLAFGSVAIMSSSMAFAGAIDRFDGDIQNKIKNGEQYTIFTDVSGSVWPKATIYQRVEATPDEAMAVFFDYSRHKEFFPDLKESIISTKHSPTLMDIDYYLVKTKLKISLEEHYTVKDQLSVSNGSYQVTWTKVKAEKSKEIQGSVLFERLPGTPATLMVYENLINPDHFLAWMFVEDAKSAVQSAAGALVTRIESLRKSGSPVLEWEKARLNEAITNSSPSASRARALRARSSRAP